MPKRDDSSPPLPSEEPQLSKAAGSGPLLALVYRDLLLLARNRMANLPPGQTLRPRDLVHEAYLRISAEKRAPFEGRKHFFFAAARAMHDILVEQARRKASQKRGGNVKRTAIEGLDIAIKAPADDILALHGALENLDEHQRQIVDLRFFAGLTMEETARIVDVPLRSLGRQWRYIRARLRADLTSPEERATHNGHRGA
jgi:RNA polymerase sigma factor (TIGR02999 family)